jgi:hypothetical protein
MHRGSVVGEVRSQVVALEEGEPQHLDFLPPTRFAEGTEQHAEFQERIARSRRGRPPGTRNLRTERAIAFIRRMFGDPFLESARVPLRQNAHYRTRGHENRIEPIGADLRGRLCTRASGQSTAAAAPSAALVITVRNSKQPGRYIASVDGNDVCTSRIPFLDAARVLLGVGVPAATRITMRWTGSRTNSLTSTVGAAAKLRVGDSGTGKPIFRPFHPYQPWE